MKKSTVLVLAFFTSFVCFLPGTVWSQADTIAVALQSKIVAHEPYYTSGIDQFQYCPSGVILAGDGFLFISTNGGSTFHTYDTLQWIDGSPTYPWNVYILAHQDRALYRLFESDSNENPYWFQLSYDLGAHWGIPEGLNRLFNRNQLAVATDPGGDKIAILNDSGSGTTLHFANDFGTSGWKTTSMDTEGYSYNSAWADANHGAYFGKELILSSDGGLSWHPLQLDHFEDSVLGRVTSGGIGAIFYPFPGIIILAGGNFTDHIAITLDTGKTWEIDDKLDPFHIDFVLPNRWIASYGASTYGPVISTDSGQTWNPSVYNAPESNGTPILSFRDSLNGLACNGYDIVARTSDGGYTWQTLDSSDYMFGHITPAAGLDSAYYAFSPFQDTNGNGAYAFFTRNRGATWKRIITNGSYYAFAGLDSAIWVGGTGYASISPLYGSGGGTTFYITKRDSTRLTAIDKNFVWISNGNELYSASIQGSNVSWHPNLAYSIPNYDSSNTYRFFPIDRNVVYAGSADTVYVTKDGGDSWNFASSMPDRALNAMHWFVFTSDTSSLRYTADGGQHFTTITVPYANAQTILPIDSVRWYVNGLYTTDAGQSWQRIPGWDNKLALYAVDSTTAFGEPWAAGLSSAQILWRLDLPFTLSSPLGVVREESNSPSIADGGMTLSALPDPVTGPTVTFQITSAREANVTLTIYDMLGHEVGQPLDNILYQAGQRHVTYDVSKLPSGTYTCRLIANSMSDHAGTAISKQFVVQR